MRIGRLKSQSGFALIAAIIVLSLLVILGLMAMMVGESEMRIVSNIDMDKKLFYIAEQTIDRILSHLHYNPEGPIKVLGIDMYSNNTEILPRMVLRGVGPLIIDEENPPIAPIRTDDRYVITATINYRDWERVGDEIARPMDQPFRIYVRVKHRDSNYAKILTADVRPITPWNFAYFSQNSEPLAGSPGYNREVIFRHRGRAASVSFSDSYGYCQSIPNFFYNRVIGDVISGDVYLGGMNAGFFMRGGPVFGGRIWWRTLFTSYDPARNQSAGCSSSCDKHPVLMGGIRASAPEIMAFEPNPEDDFWFATQGSFGVRGISEAANYRFTNVVANNRHYVPRILFLHNVDTNGNGSCEDGPCAAVGSAITPSLNNGDVDDPGDSGVMLVWTVRWDHPNAINANHQPVYAASNFATSRWYRAALMGDNLGARMQEILDADTNNCVFDGTVKSCGSLGCLVPNSRRLTFNLAGYGTVDVRPAMVPDFGKTCADLGGEGSFPYNTARATGIIFVDGDVIVSGVVDGRVSIYATGDIILDHEIEYEKHPLKHPNDLDDVDMLGLFARGDVLIPEHIALEYPPHPTFTFPDDWSDPFLGDGNFAPQGWFDSSQGAYSVGAILDDDGSEDIHACIHAAANECQYPSSGGADCAEWSSPALRSRKQVSRNEMRVGFYALPKTTGWGSLEVGNPHGRPFIRLVSDNYYAFHNMANQSGPLRVVGTIIQNYPGRVGYDYHNGGSNPTWNDKPTYVNSTCDNAYSTLAYTCQYDSTLERYYWAEDYDNSRPCNVVGHESFELTYDPRLRLTHPPMPFDIAYSYPSSPNQVPKGAWWFGYGMAAYEITKVYIESADTNLANNMDY